MSTCTCTCSWLRVETAAAVESIEIDLSRTNAERADAISESLSTYKAENEGATIVGVLCLAGGWAGGSIDSESIFGSMDRMWSMNVQSAVLASHIAAKHLAPSGALVLTGAQAGMGPTPGMVAYGISKAATIQLVSSLAADGSGLPENTWVGCIMPLTLDTPTNRAAMPDADHSAWTPLATVADLLVNWVGGDDRPESGTLVNV